MHPGGFDYVTRDQWNNEASHSDCTEPASNDVILQYPKINLK